MNNDIRTLDAATLAHLQQWIGRSETLLDDITAAPLRGLSATLDRDDVAPAPGTPVPPLWHWLYFLPQPRRSEIFLVLTNATTSRRAATVTTFLR